MRVDIKEAPATFRQALREGAPVFTDHDQRMAELLSSATVGFPLFTASLDDVKNGRKLMEEPPTTWRFMARDPAGAVIFGEVSNAKGPPKLVRVSKDPRSLLVLNAAADIDQRSDLPDDNYQLRLLRVAGVLVEALWLHSTTGKTDWFFPVLSASNELRINHAYSSDEFFARIRDMSARFRKFDNTGAEEPRSKA
jgi:hypothetical protein